MINTIAKLLGIATIAGVLLFVATGNIWFFGPLVVLDCLLIVLT